MTISPDTLFQGDTVTINCWFRELGNISWSCSSNANISDGEKYKTSYSLRGTVTQYTLKIKNLTDADKGIYTCSLNSNGTLQAQSKSLSNIKILQLSSSDDMDVFSDGFAFNLTCCSADIGEFNVTWTVSGPAGVAGRTTNNGTCSIYTLMSNNTEFPSSVTSYTCSLQREERPTVAKVIKVTYYKRGNNDANIVWAKDTINTIVTNSSLLHKDKVTASWAGIYFCVVYQGKLSTYAKLTVNVLPLPFKEEITIDPLQTYLTKCEKIASVIVKCCVNGPGYSIHFTHGTPPISDTSQNCSSTSVTFDCNTKTPAGVSCVVFNRLNDNITSDAMTISYDEEQKSYCKEQDGLPETPSGKTYVVPCQILDRTMLGNKTFTCQNGRWSEPVDDCYSARIFQELQNVQEVIKGTQVQKLLPQLLENITVIATNEKETILNSSKTLELMVQIISTVANTSVPVNPSMMQSFIKTVDIMVDKPSAWNRIGNQSTTVLNSVETFARNLVFNGTISLKNEHENRNIHLAGQTVDKVTDYSVGFSLRNITGKVFIDKSLWPGNSSTVITITYGTLKDILPKNSRVVNGLVMSTVIGKNSQNSKVGITNNTFNIKMSFEKGDTSLVKPNCVWYDMDLNMWNSSGCDTKEELYVINCFCNHLTSFAILMGPVDSTYMDIITYIGVGISLASLVVTLVIETLVWSLVIKNKTSYIRHICLVNIAVTLLVADIWFIIGAALQRDTTSASCKATAFFSFFFYLSLFFWMLTTGLILFYRMVYIFHDMSRKTMMIIAFLLGYGCPLLITIITVASTEPSKQFTSNKYCWLDYEYSKSFLAFVVPILTIVFINLLILMLVIYKLMRPSVGENLGKEDKKMWIVIAKTLAILTPLLGTTWGFGIGVVIDPTNEVIHAIFVTLNSFHGLFILISTVLLDQKVRTAVRSSISSSYWRTLRSRVQTTSADSSGTSRSMKSPARGLFGKKAAYKFFTAQESNETSGNSSSPLT
ncbi:adhesion G protein-coupled receptor F5-like [Pyxicephalus adspersus]|uniref:adhesion G protein-coupled receptor F5-like n=1 Tax=Pyxicephalus adspersus TaxID=30357 RepID=UPI003B59E92F